VSAQENWDREYLLTWSGKWHIPRRLADGSLFYEGRVSLCGMYGYRRGDVPRRNRRLLEITSDHREATVCKSCKRIEATRAR
jgi:hypothetical protein